MQGKAAVVYMSPRRGSTLFPLEGGFGNHTVCIHLFIHSCRHVDTQLESPGVTSHLDRSAQLLKGALCLEAHFRPNQCFQPQLSQP